MKLVVVFSVCGARRKLKPGDGSWSFDTLQNSQKLIIRFFFLFLIMSY